MGADRQQIVKRIKDTGRGERDGVPLIGSEGRRREREGRGKGGGREGGGLAARGGREALSSRAKPPPPVSPSAAGALHPSGLKIDRSVPRVKLTPLLQRCHC